MLAGWYVRFKDYHVMLTLPRSPTLVANLWDVTDKDIDKFTKSTFTKLGLDEFKPGTTSMSIAQAVAESRDCCTMRYLNGAAPVVYGIPTSLRF